MQRIIELLYLADRALDTISVSGKDVFVLSTARGRLKEAYDALELIRKEESRNDPRLDGGGDTAD